MLDKKSKIFFIVLILVIMASIGATYYRSIVLKDFERTLSEPEETEESIEEEEEITEEAL